MIPPSQCVSSGGLSIGANVHRPIMSPIFIVANSLNLSIMAGARSSCGPSDTFAVGVDTSMFLSAGNGIQSPVMKAPSNASSSPLAVSCGTGRGITPIVMASKYRSANFAPIQWPRRDMRSASTVSSLHSGAKGGMNHGRPVRRMAESGTTVTDVAESKWASGRLMLTTAFMIRVSF